MRITGPAKTRTQASRARGDGPARARKLTVWLLIGVMGMTLGLTSCQFPRDNTATPSASSTESETMGDQAIIDAVAASDPRVVEVLGAGTHWSGFARVLDLTIIVDGNEPISTQTLTTILTTARHAATETIHNIELVIATRNDGESEYEKFDLTHAAEGLPATVRWRGIAGNIFSFSNLDALTDTPTGAASS